MLFKVMLFEPQGRFAYEPESEHSLLPGVYEAIRHIFAQFLVPLQASMRIRIGDTAYEVPPQELCYIPAGMTHQCHHFGKLLENCTAPSIRYICEYYDSLITVNHLAKMGNYNTTYYIAWFRQQTGCSPSLYLRHVRVVRVKELFGTTNFSIMEIAAMVEYSSNSTFTRAFYNITGITPKRYRERPVPLTKAGGAPSC